jgi:hypothetical protein
MTAFFVMSLFPSVVSAGLVGMMTILCVMSVFCVFYV